MTISNPNGENSTMVKVVLDPAGCAEALADRQKAQYYHDICNGQLNMLYAVQSKLAKKHTREHEGLDKLINSYHVALYRCEQDLIKAETLGMVESDKTKVS